MAARLNRARAWSRPQAIHIVNLETDDNIPLAIPSGWHVSCLQFDAAAGARRAQHCSLTSSRLLTPQRPCVSGDKPSEMRFAASPVRRPPGVLAAGMAEGKVVVWSKSEGAGSLKLHVAPSPAAAPGVPRKPSKGASRAGYLLGSHTQGLKHSASTAHLDDAWEPSPAADVCSAQPRHRNLIVPPARVCRAANPSESAAIPRSAGHAAAPLSLVAVGPPVNGSACLCALGRGLPYVLFKHRLQCRARAQMHLRALTHFSLSAIPQPISQTGCPTRCTPASALIAPQVRHGMAAVQTSAQSLIVQFLGDDVAVPSVLTVDFAIGGLDISDNSLLARL